MWASSRCHLSSNTGRESLDTSNPIEMLFLTYIINVYID